MVNMKIIIDEEEETCASCINATMQIPSINRWGNPVCSKGHGVCQVDKCCEDYVVVTAVCGRCKYFDIVGKDLVCTKHDIPVHFAGRICDDFSFDGYRRLSKELKDYDRE